MTERQWDQSADVRAMLEACAPRCPACSMHHPGRCATTDVAARVRDCGRRLRLYAVGRARLAGYGRGGQSPPPGRPGVTREEVDVEEDWLDAGANIADADCPVPSEPRDVPVPRHASPPWPVRVSLVSAPSTLVHYWGLPQRPGGAGDGVMLLRCLFANPAWRVMTDAHYDRAYCAGALGDFRHTVLLPADLPSRGEGAVLRLAEAICQGGTWDELPILADAVQEAAVAGESVPAELLAHLRGPGPHCRGCWAVDLLTGRWRGGPEWPG